RHHLSISQSYCLFPFLFFFLRIPTPPISTLFPYTTLFRSKYSLHNYFLHPKSLSTIIIAERHKSSHILFIFCLFFPHINTHSSVGLFFPKNIIQQCS